MIYKNSFRYSTWPVWILFLAFGLLACSQEKQPNIKSEQSSAAEPVNVTMYKNPNCQCCSNWAAYMEENGFSVTNKPTDSLTEIKKQRGVPDKLSSCHTALVDGYVVEGHVPAEAIDKLLKDRPEAKGIAVPGMPPHSPGMAENPKPVDVYFFNGPDMVAYFDKF